MRRRPKGKRALVLIIACVWAIALLPGRVSVAVSGPPEFADLLASLVEFKKLTASDAAAGDAFGISAEISGDTAVVGADHAGIAGAAYAFERNQGGANNWGEVKKLTASDAAAGDWFGHSVAIFGDTVVVGAPRDDDGSSGSGSAYVFERDQGGADNWGEAKKLTASDAASDDWFGTAVAISGDTIVVGARLDDDAGSGSGSAYVFGRNHGGADNWGQIKKLTASDAAAGDWFGASVTISGDTAVVGAHRNDDAGSSSGSAYVFGRDQGGADNWGEVTKLTASDAAASDEFGGSVAILGDTAVVGAPYASTRGAVYTFDRNQGGANNWGEVKKLTASDAAADDFFGYSVAILGDTTLVGAPYASSSTGSAYAFERNQGGANNWGQVRKLIASDAAANDEFGFSVAISGDTMVVATPTPSSVTGAAYLFRRTGFYVLDGFGGLHAAGAGGVPVTPAPPYFGFDIARDLELSGNGAYVLDGFGGVHAAGGLPAMTPGPPYFGFDIAQDLEFVPGGGGYALDGYGGVHAVGGAPVMSPATPYFGFDAARDLEIGGGGYYVLDAWGGLHVGAGATPISPGPPYFGFDIAKDLELSTGGGYALDGFGGVHALGGAPVLTPPTPYFGFDIARDLELALGGGHYVLDGLGGLHAGGGATVISPAPPYLGFDAARDLEIR